MLVLLTLYLYFVSSNTPMIPIYHVVFTCGRILSFVLYIHIYHTAILCGTPPLSSFCGIDHYRLILHFHCDIQRILLLIVPDTV